MAGLRH
jgi:hypothetical protein